MWIEGPTETVVALFLILSGWAKQMKKSGQVDTIGAGRFDALVGLVFAMATGNLIGRLPHGDDATCSDTDEPLGVVPPPGPVPTTVALVVKASTAAGHDNDPADIPGYGPVPASVARRMIAGLPDRDADDTVDDDLWRFDDPEDPGGRWDRGFRPTDPRPTEPHSGSCSAISGKDVRFKILPVDSVGWSNPTTTGSTTGAIDVSPRSGNATTSPTATASASCLLAAAQPKRTTSTIATGGTLVAKPTSTPWGPAAATTTARPKTTDGPPSPGPTAPQPS
jgi:hypothetical protein